MTRQPVYHGTALLLLRPLLSVLVATVTTHIWLTLTHRTVSRDDSIVNPRMYFCCTSPRWGERQYQMHRVIFSSPSINSLIYWWWVAVGRMCPVSRPGSHLTLSGQGPQTGLGERPSLVWTMTHWTNSWLFSVSSCSFTLVVLVLIECSRPSYLVKSVRLEKLSQPMI